jgi:sugar-specific transcriptional regulator TrmB
MSEFDKLVEAAQAERQEIFIQIESLDAEKAILQERLKRYDRVISAINPNAPKKAPAPKGPRKQDWRVSSGMIEQVYNAMRASNNGEGEFTVAEIAELTGVNEATIYKTVNVLHEEGRIHLARKHKQKRYWAVVR